MMQLSDHGDSLVSVMVTVAIVGIIVMVLISLSGNLSSVSTRMNQKTEVDNFRRYVRGTIMNPSRCQYAFRNSNLTSAPALRWDNPQSATNNNELNLGFIRSYTGSGSLEVVAATSGVERFLDRSVRNLFVSRIYLRPRDFNGDGVGDGAAVSPSVINRPAPGATVGTPYEAYPNAEIVIDIASTTPSLFGGALRPLVFPLIVYRQVSTGTIDYCEPVERITQHLSCDALQAQKDGNPCVYTAGTCETPIIYVKGMNADSTPICACKVNCH